MSEKKLKVKLVHSTAGRDGRQEQIVRGLGLRKLYGERELVDTQAVRGMVAKIPHLVQIVEENIVPKQVKPKKAEAAPKAKAAPKTAAKKSAKKKEVKKDEAK